MEDQAGIAEKAIDRKTSNVSRTNLKVLLRWLLRVIQGAIIGVGAIIPGVSGGALCVIFGVYQPMMALFAHPFRAFKTHARLLLPVLIGWALGFVGLASVVKMMFETSYHLAVWLFIGLIAGMLPSLFDEAGKEGRKKESWISFAVSLVLVYTILQFVENGVALNIEPSIFWFAVCGVFWGVSLIVPGMSSSTFLIFLGLYKPMTAGISQLSLPVVLPLIAGVALTILLGARPVNKLFEKHYSVAFHSIIGVVIASTLVIIPMQYIDVLDTVLRVVCFAAGFIMAWMIDKIGKKLIEKRQES